MNTEPGQGSEVTGTDVPLMLMSTYELKKNQPQRLPQLPSHKLRYSLWHELKSTQATGDQLKAPRIRNGPDVKEKNFHTLRDDEGQLIHHSLQGKQRKQHQYKTENWENTIVANFPYQELNDAYQRQMFFKVLKRLIRVRVLNLSHNNLTDLSSCSFPCCQEVILNNNFFSSFKDLPRIPEVKYLSLNFNDISSLTGLNRFAKSSLESLNLYGNGITFTVNYRQKVFQILPNLKVLDGIPKLESDQVFEEEAANVKNSCVIT